MKKVLLIYLVLIAGIIAWYFTAGKEKNKNFEDDKAAALKVSKHSFEFNKSMNEVMDKYYQLTDGFVKEDTALINKNIAALKSSLDSLKVQELQKDSAIYETAISFWDNTKNSLLQILSDSDLEAKRRSFNQFSDNLYSLINSFHYDVGNLYWLECGTAFGEDSPGYWLSEKEKSNNPYGKKDCVSLKKIINVDSVK